VAFHGRLLAYANPQRAFTLVDPQRLFGYRFFTILVKKIVSTGLATMNGISPCPN
jgi:hypothetical protein